MAAMFALTACDQTADEARVTVTKTVEREAQPAREVDPAECAQIDSQRAINARLHRDGLADDYSAEYDRLARNAGCD